MSGCMFQPTKCGHGSAGHWAWGLCATCRGPGGQGPQTRMVALWREVTGVRGKHLTSSALALRVITAVFQCLRLPNCAQAAGPGPPGGRATVHLSLDVLPAPDPASVPEGFRTGVFKELGMRFVPQPLSTENHLGFIKSHYLVLYTKSTSDASDLNVKI